MARKRRHQLDLTTLGPEEIVLDTMFVLMRQCSTQGVHAGSTEETADRLRALIEKAELPLVLQFRDETAYRDHVLVPMRAEVFRRSQPLLESLSNLSVREMAFETVPPLESVLALAEVLVKGSHGPSDAMRRARLPHIGVSTRRRVLPKEVDEAEDRRHEAMTRIGLASGYIEELPRQADQVWPWESATEAVRQIEGAVLSDPHAALRTLEHAPGFWTPARRAHAASLRTAIALAWLGADAFIGRSTTHAVLALGAHGYGERGGKPVPEAAEQVLASMQRTPHRFASGITAHRMRVTAILHTLARPADAREGEPALLGLVRAAYEIERQRCPVELSFALTAVDLLARFGETIASEPEPKWSRVLLASAGPVPAGAYVLADGRLGIAFEPAEDAWRPKVKVGNEIFVPREPVQLYSPIAMAQIGR